MFAHKITGLLPLFQIWSTNLQPSHAEEYFEWETERMILQSFRHLDFFEGEINFPKSSVYLKSKGPNASLRVRGWMGGTHGVFANCWHCYGNTCSSEEACCGPNPNFDCFDGVHWRKEVCCDKELQNYENHPEVQTSILHTIMGIEQVYQRLTARRLEHLTTLALPIWNRSVLELAGRQGDLTHYFTDRGCHVTVVEPRKSNLLQIRRKVALGYIFPDKNKVSVLPMDLEKAVPAGSWEIVFCFGLLYHLEQPLLFLSRIAPLVRDFLILETLVSSSVVQITEPAAGDSSGLSGRATLLRREDVFYALKVLFEYVYVPITQPNHEEFAIDWANQSVPSRAIFVASRRALPSEGTPLMQELPMQQMRSW